MASWHDQKFRTKVVFLSDSSTQLSPSSYTCTTERTCVPTVDANISIIITARCTIQYVVQSAYCDCMSSVRLSVWLWRWKSWKLTARTVSSTLSLFVAQRPSTYSQGNMGRCGETRGGWEKVAYWSTKAAISLKRVKIEEKLLWRAYRNSPTLFRTVPSPTPYGLLFPKIGVHNPNPKFQSQLFQERVKQRTSNLAGIFTVSIRTKAH